MSSGNDESIQRTPRRPRNVVVGHSGGSSVSGLSTPSRFSRRQQQKNSIHDDATTALLQLSGTPSSPQRLLNSGISAMREEDMMETNLFGNLPTEFSDDEAAEDDFDEPSLPDIERELALLSVSVDNEQPAGENNSNSEPVLYGAPAGWEPPSAPADYSPEAPKISKDEPENFASVDNPGNWSSFTYRPKFGGD